MKYIKRFKSFFLSEQENLTQETPQTDTKTVSEPVETNATSEDKVEDILTNKEEISLQKELNDWSSLYADKFKFKNAEPRVETNNVVATIIPKNQEAVAQALASIIKILTHPIYKDKATDISVIGHTSSTWGGAPVNVAAENNMKLSQIRAVSVIKTIQEMGKEAVANIKFIPIGKGLTELIIRNDATEGAAEEGVGGKQIAGAFPFGHYTNPEQKQSVNRRVVITLPKFDPVYKPKVQPPKPPKKIEKPVAPDPTLIKFNYDSYIPTKTCYNLVKKIAEDIVAYNSKNVEKIRDVYICSHSNKGENKDVNDHKRQDKVIFTISLNRAVTIKNIMSLIAKDVNFHVIPASYYVTKTNDPANNKKVEIEFEVNDRVKLAKAAFDKLAKLYKVDNSNGEYTSDKIRVNTELRNDVIRNLSFRNKNIGKFIPPELWDDVYGKYEPNLARFKKKLINIAGSKEEVEGFLYDFI
jgi:outer membrane protein OmpA-like peptidoglycan-associated protein